MVSDPSSRRRLTVFAALWLFVLLVLVVFRKAVLPFAGAALIAYLVAPLVNRISRWSVGGKPVPRWVAILLVYAGFFVVVYLTAIALLPTLYRELARIGREALTSLNALTPDRMGELARQTEQWLNARGFPVDMSGSTPWAAPAGGRPLSLDLEELLRGFAERTSGWVNAHLREIVSLSGRVVGGTLTSVFMLFFMLMVAAFFSIDIRNIRTYVKGLMPREFAPDAALLVHRIDRSLAGVVRGQLTICLVNGVLTLVGLLIFGVPFAYLLATIATMLSLIPIFGAILSSVPIVLIAFSKSWEAAVAMLLWVIGIHALEAYFLNPKIMGSAARIHPVIVAFSLIAGERTFGLVGALFAVPLASIVVACFDYARQKAQEERVQSPAP
ncbi:MAG TPA: AI-2E family transporter [Myxococcaceae bacterium]|nr:AI-2E family transporter [Myxococcaceae bacterium]